MRRLPKLLLCVAVLSLGLALPSQAQANDCETVDEVYARYARAIVGVAHRGTGAMRDVFEESAPRIKRLLRSGHYERARHMAKKAIEKIENISDATKGRIRELAMDGVEALLEFEGEVRPSVLRGLIADLLRLAHRAANYVEDVEDRAVQAIKSLFISDGPDVVRPRPRR